MRSLKNLSEDIFIHKESLSLKGEFLDPKLSSLISYESHNLSSEMCISLYNNQNYSIVTSRGKNNLKRSNALNSKKSVLYK